MENGCSITAAKINSVVAGSDPQKNRYGRCDNRRIAISRRIAIAGVQSRRIQESSRDTSSNKKYQCSSNTPQKGSNKRGAHEHVARLGRVVTNVEPNHWRFVGDDGLVLAPSSGNMEATSRRLSSIQSVSRNLGAAVRNMSRSLAAQKTNSSRSKSSLRFVTIVTRRQ